MGEGDLQKPNVPVPVESGEGRQTGIPTIGDVPWGTHFCQFYQDKQDLIDILVPYFKTGLKNNEFCIWVTSEPLRAAEAKAALAASVENLELYIANGQLEILDTEWYTLGGKFESDLVLHGWVDRLESAKRRGFAGLRLTGNTFWLEAPEWRGFMEYEAAVDAVFEQHQILANCTYSLSKCSALQIMDVINNHTFALVKRTGKWEVIRSAERKKVEASLRESEARYRALVTAASDVVYRMSPDWKLMLYLRGRDFIPDTQEPSSTWLQKYIPSEDQAYLTAAIKEAIRTKSTFELEHRVRRVDGSAGWTFSRAIPIQNAGGEIVEWFGAASDITERKRAEEALRRSEARWNATIENLEAGVVIATDSEQVIYRNPAALAMHGFTRDQGGLGALQEMSRIFQLWTPDGRLLTLDEWPMRRIKRGEKVHRLELRLRRPDQGWEKVISYSGAMVESAIGERLMFISAQDLTEQRKAERALRESEKLESLGTLASGIAHDFNNLLGAVLAQAELAAAGLAAGSYPNEELETIREVAIRGSEIVRQLMIYAGKEGDVFEFIHISNTVREMYGFLKSAISRRATLVTDLSEQLPPIKARPAELRQVVMNLVVNASDAIKDGDGIIRVTTQRVTVGPNNADMTTRDLTEGDYVQLEVSDTGSGMSHEVRNRIFDPFFSTKSAGRGLGLPVIQGIVQSLHGTIRVESVVGKGTTFQILIPSAGAGARLTCDTIAGKEQELQRTSEATVLLVEDEVPLRLAVKKMLGKAGFTVVEAGDGSEAVKLLHSRAARFDLLILDVTLPGRSSDEVLREAVERWPQIKVILTSAYSEEMATARLTASQVRGFVRKPFQLGVLVQTLQNVLSPSATSEAVRRDEP
jgi:PAS domain S-box-containing protein